MLLCWAELKTLKIQRKFKMSNLTAIILVHHFVDISFCSKNSDKIDKSSVRKSLSKTFKTSKGNKDIRLFC